MNKLYSLQNGTDVRGVAYKDENSDLDITLSSSEVELIALGFATWLTDVKKKSGLTIAIGRDSRVTGEGFLNVAQNILTSVGINVINCGLSTTPSMFMSTIMDGYKADGAIMFTASHMPYIYNGMKMFTDQGCLEKSDLKSVLDIAVSKNFIESNSKAEVVEKSLIDDYAKVLVDKIREGISSKKNFERPFTGMKIIVDAGNGAGGFFAEKVLESLGADTEGSQFLDPDGMFPNHIPNPENKEAMESISNQVLKVGADLGIIFDTDVDRAAIVGADGKSINKNVLIALISRIILNEHPNTTIVTDSVTSDGLAEFIKSIGGIHHRFKRGYKNVINESIRLNSIGQESHLAIETSGHAAIKENYFLDDGAYLVAKILIEACKSFEKGEKVTDLIKDLREPKESSEYRIKITEEDFRAYAQSVIESVTESSAKVEGWEVVKENYEGVRVSVKNPDERGWFLLRSSLHEPLLVLNIESDIEGGVDRIHERVAKLLPSK